MFARRAVAALVFSVLPLTVSAAGSQQHLRGELTTVSGNRIVVRTASGDVAVGLTSKTAVLGAVPAQFSDIQSGDYLGIANTGGANANALEVVIFDEALRGAGAGDGPWDLPVASGRSSMTNGTVQRMSTMTNGSAKRSGDRVTLTYPGGSRTIRLSDDVPVVRVHPAKTDALKTGAHVFVLATPGTQPVAKFVVVGERGAVPPM